MNLSLTPTGHLIALESSDGAETHFGADRFARAFSQSQSAGIIALAGGRASSDWPLSWAYWRDFGSRYLLSLCRLQPSSAKLEPIPPPDPAALASLTLGIPPMPGAEYCTPEALASIWVDLDAWARDAVARNPEGFAGFLHEHAPLWRQVGRVCFHLAENKNDSEFPFAFMATYIPRLGKNARAQHLPLSQALREYAGTDNREALLRLLEPVHEAGTRCAWVQELLESSDIYHPLAWTPEEAYSMLKDVPALEESGLVVRLPDWWAKRPRPRVQVSIGSKVGETLSAKALLDFKMQLTLDGADLTPEEIAALTQAGEGLAFLRGKWVEVDGEKLRQALDQWRRVEAEAGDDGLSFVEGMRLLAGARRDLSGSDPTLDETGWAFVEAGERLREILAGIRDPSRLAAVQTRERLHATLRPYQQTGVNWLWFLSELGLGACLADDMGLGKTIQVISLLLAQKDRKAEATPSLLVLPASLLSNWKSEIERFAPSLKVVCAHPSEAERSELERIAADPAAALSSVDAVLATYGMLQRMEWIGRQRWNLIVLDEAQAIKNPVTKQARAVKSLRGRARIALTGTPVENRLSDLWSLFDFTCPGLLGTAPRFKQFVSSLEKDEPPSYAPLRTLVQPYILRRLKTDRSVINDLPEKVETTAWCGLSKVQARLYGQAVKELAQALEEQGEGIKRRGLILSTLMRFKQICNHPGQALGDGDYTPERSGKFERLRDLAEEIASRQEKVLVFTQFREMTAPIAAFLAGVFGRPGLVLHGGTPVAERKKLVDRFQHEDGPPFFVLSLKAGGSGLNLTAAAHVVHFDRWWNPAVENQATDRAFRIGQKRNVMVHKFVCKGTVEEKIDALIRSKAGLAQELLEGAETLLTEMDDEALLKMVALDLEKVRI
ncbi:DEAD/DEAH box helicase [Geoalkalibacter halelectricus]|uniref:DEAD/DEAH box helicase n=1 Tax=Geoalkalibacter halelectricus TaxID=2847045 RepID=A0ABY5ZJ77_9BACT|nr:DEAD/DEAH box helicase [Geoalkalibacter halelectricus]MDO3377313.1 DEAD/DEAH box helicase [Geoalkalibacter halelectricus]UWZ79185.1 DEAD/DEAH box helicase [Geoalkalibacter halelectricus]